MTLRWDAYRVWVILGHLVTTLLDWISIGRLNAREKDLEILLLRQQLTMVERQLDKPVCAERVEKLTLATLATQLKNITKRPTKRLGEIIHLFQLETVLKWHREQVHRKGRAQRGTSGGRPRTRAEVESLFIKFVPENPDWGYGKLDGELRKPGCAIN